MAWNIFKEKLRHEPGGKYGNWYLDRYYKDPSSGYKKQVSFEVNSKGQMWVDKILISDNKDRFRKRVFPSKGGKVPFSYEMKSKPTKYKKSRIGDFI